jgi:uncharacterized protein (TIGR02466 family)
MEIKFDILKPFGPRISQVQLPEDILEKLTSITDDLIVNEDRKSNGDSLVGQIKEEIKISEELLVENDLYNFFMSHLKAYVEYCLVETKGHNKDTHDVQVGMTSMWFNEMQPKGEYNPVHFHGECTISSTLYLKIPSNRPKRNIKNKEDLDGVIEFIDRSVSFDSLQRPTGRIEPKEGLMLIWPSNLLHTVYPFLGDEVRRSIAWNGAYRIINKSN